MKRFVASLLLLFLVQHPAGHGQIVFDSLGITVQGITREYSFTNKQSAFLYGETNAPNMNGWEGFNVTGHEFVDDYILVINGRPLDRASATTTVYPDYLVRAYPEGIIEEVRLTDSVALMAIHVSCPGTAARIEVVPLFTDIRSRDDCVMHDSAGVMLLARASHLKRTDQDNYPVWLAVYGAGFTLHRTDFWQGNQFSPFMLSAGSSRRRIIVFAVANASGEARSLAFNYGKKQRGYIAARRKRMVALLAGSEVTTNNPRFTKALAWAKLSLDALIMNQGMHGIFAGLPWFNNYWGRDTFISLPGAALVTGRFDEARTILRSFGRFQERDSSSRNYGRIPNLITPPTAIYNTADGTPRFVLMAKEYIERSGDTAFVREVYPIVRRAMRGTLLYHTDSLFMLTHGDAETWMDAVGPNGPWSPRGNRANDVEALWLRQIDASAWFARQVGDDADADTWERVQSECRRNLIRMFLTDQNHLAIDRLRENGSQDTTLRPNQIFLAPLLEDEMRADVVRTVLTRLTYAYGVASLSQDDPNFHPYHQDEPYYPKDATYHNGTVWTWLQGPLISELCSFGRHDIAGRLTENSVHQILDRGAAGTQSELLDAVPHPGEAEPRLSGTFSQAWTLAEFIRNFYDDYLGVRIDRFTPLLTLRPHFLPSVDSIEATLKFEGKPVGFKVQRDSVTTWVLLDWRAQDDDMDAMVELSTPAAGLLRSRFEIPKHSLVEAWVAGNRIAVFADSRPLVHTSSRVVLPTLGPLPQCFEFLEPAIHPGLRALKGPDYPLLTNTQITQVDTHATLLADVADSVGDDRGTGAYTYPLNANFLPGIFDITHFRLAADSVNAYFTLTFRALSDPGWHPEYGFQLTYAAIAINEDSAGGAGKAVIAHNAQYHLDPRSAYQKLLLVGGGVQLEDTSGKVVAAYVPIPGDEAHPLGDVRAGTISFSLLLSLLGHPGPNWTFTILAGGQDDHGGSGLGEFRTVEARRGEWNGGGKQNPGDPNIYDVLTVHLAPRK